MLIKRYISSFLISAGIIFSLSGCSSSIDGHTDTPVVESHLPLIGDFIFPEMTEWERKTGVSGGDANGKLRLEYSRIIGRSKLNLTIKYIPYDPHSKIPTLREVEDRASELKRTVENSGITFKVMDSEYIDFQGIPAFYFHHQLIYEGESEVDTEIRDLSFIVNKDLYLIILDIFMPDQESQEYAQDFWERLLLEIKPIKGS